LLDFQEQICCVLIRILIGVVLNTGLAEGLLEVLLGQTTRRDLQQFVVVPRLLREDRCVDEVRADKTGDCSSDEQLHDLVDASQLSDEVHQRQEHQKEDYEVKHGGNFVSPCLVASE